MPGVPPLWHRLFKPEPCSDDERWRRVLAGLGIWLTGFTGVWWYVIRHEGACKSPWGDHCLVWHYTSGLGLHLLGALFWLASFSAVLVHAHRSEITRTAIVPYFGFLWLIGLWLLLALFGLPRWFVVVLTFAMLGMVTVAVAFRGEGDRDFIRGARCVSLPDYLRLLTRHLGRTGADPAVIQAVEARDPARTVLIAGAPLPPGNESLHTLICASTGAGKSVTLHALLANIRARGERAIVLDNGHEFHRRLGRPCDVVMGPLANDHGWALSCEIREPYEWARFARSVVPDGHGESRSWHEYAQRFLANLGEAMGPGVSNRELIAALTAWSPADLAPLLRGTTSAVMLQDGGERLLTNVRSIFSGYLQGWRYTPEGRFSFRDYMAERDDAAWLWIPYREAELGVARGLVTCWTDMLVTAGFDRTEGAPLTWIVIDELDSLGELSSLIEATTKLRKRRVAVVAAIQSLSQLTTHYGPDKARTLLNCFSNLLVLRSVEPDTAEALSRHLGEREHWDTSYSESTTRAGLGQGSDTSGTSRAKRQSRVVLPSEIQALPDLHGFLKPAGPWPVVKVRAELS